MTGSPNSSRTTVSETSERPTKIAKTQEQELDDDEEGGGGGEGQEAMGSKNPKLQRYLVAVEYIGTRFCGSQKQLNGRTVVGVLEEAFHKFIGQPVSISLSSRTDAGVHAMCNVCSVDVERISKRKPGEVLPPHEPAVVRKATNHFLQKSEGDIMVTDVRCVPSDFHARFKAQERTYFYRLLSGPDPLPIFEKDRAWHIPEELNLVAMQEACKVLVGHHDFSSFRASGCQAKSPIRTLKELSVSEVDSTPYFPSITDTEQCISSDKGLVRSSDHSSTELAENYSSSCNTPDLSSGKANMGFGIRRRHRCYVVTARARSFLYHQVRLLVGVLKAVGTGDLTTSDVMRILDAKSVTAASPMAPASGLYLGHVKYDLP